MASGIALQAKVNAALAKVNATARPVSLRTALRSGGNPVLGTGQTVTNVDTLLVPQPAVQMIGIDGHSASAAIGSGGLIQFGDYRMTLSGAIPEATLRASEIIYGTDVLKIIVITPAAFGGIVASWDVIARTVKAS